LSGELRDDEGGNDPEEPTNDAGGNASLEDREPGSLPVDGQANN
jgi:hypothetical protein